MEECAVVGAAVADRPELGVEQGVLCRGFDLVQRALEEGVDAAVRGGDVDPGGLAEHGGPAHEALDCVEQLRRIAVVDAVRVVHLRECEGHRGDQHRGEIQREGRRHSDVDLVPRRWPQRVGQQDAGVGFEHQALSSAS